MSTATSAVDISKAWLTYVTDRFMLENGCIRPEVEEEYRRLESADSFTQDRELWRTYTDTLIDKILQSPPEMRRHTLCHDRSPFAGLCAGPDSVRDRTADSYGAEGTAGEY